MQLGSFRDVPLHGGRKCDAKVCRQQFFRSLCTNLRTRMVNISANENSCATPIEDIKVLYPCNWPDEIYLTYGEGSISRLARRFNIDERSSVRAFRLFVDNGGRVIPSELRPLILALGTLPVSRAECERGFSQMNLMMTHIRTF